MLKLDAMSKSTSRILVIDDDKLIRWSLKEILSHEDYRVDTVATYEDALKQVAAESYTLIFTDFEVCGENLSECISQITEHQTGARIVILSALTRDQVEAKLDALEVFRIIEKPFSSETIKAVAGEVAEASAVKKEGLD